MINVKKLNYAYRGRPKLFDDLDLQLETGQIYGLLGRNGAGKTSLLHILSGLLFPQAGEVEVMGFHPRRRQQPFLADMFLVSEDHYTPNVRISRYLRMYAPFYPKFDKDYFGDLLQEFGLTANQRMRDLSYGERKKVVIAFGLATRCRLLLMDEPTNGLDIPAKKQFQRLIAGAAEPERTFIISTHEVHNVKRLIDPVIILDEGKIVLQESLEEIGQKISFQYRFQEPSEGEFLYYELGPDGYICLEPRKEHTEGVDIDLEILFNAVVHQPETFRNIFQKTVNI